MVVDVYKAAKYYLDLGWSILPIAPDTKKPTMAWKEFQDRKPTYAEVEYWLNNKWQLAVVTGDISGIAIVDDDRVKHGLNEWGFSSPLEAKTQSGGKHYYFKYDREIHSHSNANIHVDLKAWHSYCLLPPFNGREWIKKPTKENLKALTPIPDDVVRLINSDTKTITGGEKTALIMSDFIKIPEGGRTDALHKIACSVFQKYQRDDGMQILLGINQTYSPPLLEDEFIYQVGGAWNFIQNNQLADYPQPQSLKDITAQRMIEKELEKDCPKTGLPTLDRMSKGFVPKHVYLLSGTSNVGKTSLACCFAVNVARQGKKVLYLALEPDTNVVEYIASIVHDKRFDELDPATDYDFGDLPIEIYKKDVVRTPEKLLELIDKCPRYDLIIIDHIGYFVTDKQNTYQDQSNMMKILPKIADIKKSAIMAIAHLRKPPQNKKVGMPSMDDVSGSAAFKQDSTDVWLIYKELDKDDKTKTRYTDKGFLIVGKSKSGYTGPIELEFPFMKAGMREPISNLSMEDIFK